MNENTIYSLTKESKDAFRLYADLLSAFARVEIYSDKSKAMAANAFQNEMDYRENKELKHSA